MLTEQDKQAILNGAYGRTRKGKKAKLVYVPEIIDEEKDTFLFVIFRELDDPYSIWMSPNFKKCKDYDFEDDIVGLWEAEIEVEPFNLTRALNGEPVALRNGMKAYVTCLVPNSNIKYHDLLGYCETPSGNCHRSWYKTGLSYDEYNIVAMWQEPKRPTVTLTLPCPLKELNIGQSFFRFTSLGNIVDEPYSELLHQKLVLAKGRCFATREEAKAWQEAMKNNRR